MKYLIIILILFSCGYICAGRSSAGLFDTPVYKWNFDTEEWEVSEVTEGRQVFKADINKWQIEELHEEIELLKERIEKLEQTRE